MRKNLSLAWKRSTKFQAATMYSCEFLIKTLVALNGASKAGPT